MLPTPAEVERTLSGPVPLDRIRRKHREDAFPSPALNRDGLGQNSAKGMSASPTLKMRNNVSDRMPGLLFGLNFWTYKASLNSPLAYSDKPPSNWTNTSRRIQLYGPTT